MTRAGIFTVVSVLAAVFAGTVATRAQTQEQQISPQQSAPPQQQTPQPAPAPQATPQSKPPVPEIVVTAPKPKQTGKPRRVAKPAPVTAPPSAPTPPRQLSLDGEGTGLQPSLQVAPGLGKTGTKLGDLPLSVQIIPHEILTQQGDTMLRQAITNASGVNQGGQDSLGYFDHFMIRGLNAQIYSDGFSDGDELGGISHSLNGIKQIEILEGPGSALFGSGPPGGTINLVHFKPDSQFHYGASVETGSWGTITNQDYITGPTTVPGLDYRVDATFSHADGFRDLNNHDYEIRPDFLWTLNEHTFEFSVDARDQHQTPDSYGLIYYFGSPISSVPETAKYSTPFAFADQKFLRPVMTDQWLVNDYLTINNRFAYTYRTIDALRNGDSTRTFVCTNPAAQKDPVTGLPCVLDQVDGRQLRQQTDVDNSLDYQFEPLWTFGIGPTEHTLLTGFEALHQNMRTQRSTADLPNISNVFAPQPPELSESDLTFRCDASHSCDDDKLMATYLSAYATDQIDMTERWKVRLGVRQEWWDTALLPLSTVPGRFTSSAEPIIGGQELDAKQTPLSWNVGTLYKVLPGVAPFFGVSRSYLTNFNSENTQQGIGPAETALQYEGGVKVSMFDDWVVLTTSIFRIYRDNVAAAVTLGGVETTVYDSQKTNGVEAALDAKITEQWHMLANATVMQAVITNNPQGITSVGHEPQGVPRYLANLWTTYNFSIAGIPGFQIGAGLNYEDKTYSDITNVNSVPAFVVANAEFSYDASWWSATLNVRNFTNSRYFIAANAAGAYVGEPLAAYITLRIKG